MALALEMLAFRCLLVLELSHSACLRQCSTSVMADLQPVCIILYVLCSDCSLSHLHAFNAAFQFCVLQF